MSGAMGLPGMGGPFSLDKRLREKPAAGTGRQRLQNIPEKEAAAGRSF